MRPAKYLTLNAPLVLVLFLILGFVFLVFIFRQPAKELDNCTQYRAEGIGNFVKDEDSRYRKSMDKDGDNMSCEL